MMSQDLRNQKPDVDNSSDIRVKQSPNGELKQFLKQPFGIALAMILIVLLSGTTFVVPVALMVMYRVSAAEAGSARPTPDIRARAMTAATTVRKRFSFMSLLSRIGLY